MTSNLPKITQSQLNLFQSLFRGRTDIYARYWINFQQNKSGYAPVYSLSKGIKALTNQVILNHLLGKELIGIYPLLSDNTTYFLAVDFDKDNWFEESISLIEKAKKLKLPAYLERSKSGNGGHVWLFFKQAIPAIKARQLGKFLLGNKSLIKTRAYDRMFSSQDSHSQKGFGNLIALPLYGQAIKQNNSVFIGKNNEVYRDQWQFLGQVKKIDKAQITRVLTQSITKTIIYPRIKIKTDKKVKQNKNKKIQKPRIKTTASTQVKLVLAEQIYIPETYLPDSLYKFCNKSLNIPNPKFYELERRGYSTWQTSRVIKNLQVKNKGIYLPLGFLSQIQDFSSKNNLELFIDDQQVVKKSISFKTTLKLKSNQQKLIRMLFKHERVILEAKPGFGKTMIGLYLIKRRRQPTLIIVHTKTLLHQWRKRIEQYFELEKGDLGIIGDSKWKLGKKITIASYQTLYRRDLKDITDKFGFIVVDECHHVPAKTFSQVLKQFPAKYVLGLTATAYRRDKLEKLMHFYLSPIIIQALDQKTKKSKVKPLVPTKLITKRTKFSNEENKNTDFNELAELLVQDKDRNQLIIDQIITILKTDAKCLVLTERIKHCEILLKKIRKQIKGIHAAVITGRITKKKREQTSQRLKQKRFQLLLATGKLIGEGFDWPQVSHLFLAFPFSWKGKLVQYVGRVQRQCKNKTQAYVYDFVDYNIPMLRKMYFRRLRTYRELKLEQDKNNINKSKTKQIAENQLSIF